MSQLSHKSCHASCSFVKKHDGSSPIISVCEKDTWKQNRPKTPYPEEPRTLQLKGEVARRRKELKGELAWRRNKLKVELA